MHAEAPAQEDSKTENIKQTAYLPTQALQSRLIISLELCINFQRYEVTDRNL